MLNAVKQKDKECLYKRYKILNIVKQKDKEFIAETKCLML